jgi:hypothetical protein
MLSENGNGSGRFMGRLVCSKLKGIAGIEFSDGTMCQAEIHWDEAHGIGKKEHKIKQIIE